MLYEAAFVSILAAGAFLAYNNVIAPGKGFNKRLTVYKDVGGHTVKEVEFKIKEQQLPLDPDDPSNTAWFLVTKKTKGKKFIFPRPPYEHWISDDHCIIYSKSYKGNNYACLIDSSTYFKDKKLAKVASKGKEEKELYALEDGHGKVHLAKFILIEEETNEGTEDNPQMETTKHLGMIDINTEMIPVLFPKAAHNIEPIFDERYLPEMVSLSTTMNQIFDFKGWWDKHGAMMQGIALIAIVMMNAIFTIKMFDAATKGPIKHELTVHVDTPEQLSYEDVTPETPEPPPDAPPSGGLFGNAVKGAFDGD